MWGCEVERMTVERKRYLDSLWMNSEVGEWLKMMVAGNKRDADKLLRKIYSEAFTPDGTCIDERKRYPFRYLMGQEKEMTAIIKNELKDKKEGREYLAMIEAENEIMMVYMVGNEFSMIGIGRDE